MKTEISANILAIDTSGGFASICVYSAGTYYCWKSAGENSHNEEILSGVRHVLELAKINPSELNLLLIGAGPGSFTGLRIGFGFLKGLAVSQNLPLERICSFAARACESGSQEIILVSADARRDESFVGMYLREEKYKCIFDVQIIPNSRIDSLVAEISQKYSKSVIKIQDSADENISPARGLIKAWMEAGKAIPKFSLDTIINIEPEYVRSVAAKTIAERGK